MEDHILGIDPLGQGAIHLDAAHLELAQGQGLGGQHIAHLAGADAKGDRAKSAVGGGVAVAAGNSHPRLGEALLGGDDMDNALVTRANVVKANPEILTVLFQRLHHRFCQGSAKGRAWSSVGTM